MNEEDKQIAEVIRAARTVQEFLWNDMKVGAGFEEFKRMYRKRVVKIDAIKMSNPHWKVELRKRLLQIAAISVNLIHKLDNGVYFYDGIHPDMETNLPEYTEEVRDCKFCESWVISPFAVQPCPICGKSYNPSR